MGLTRDTDKSALYAAEDLYSRMCARANRGDVATVTAIAGTEVLLPAERRFGQVDDVHTYLNALIASDFLSERYPRVTAPTVRLRRGDRGAHYEYATRVMALPDTAQFRREHVVLHEMAHHLVATTIGTAVADHGQDFRRVLCDLHTAATGVVGGWALMVVLTENGVPPGTASS